MSASHPVIAIVDDEESVRKALERLLRSSEMEAHVFASGAHFLEAVAKPAIDFIDDKDGKPIGIQEHIGRRPIAAFGNSDGDRQMLEWTQGGDGARLMMLVHHDDAAREFAYGPESKIGTFNDALMDGATEKK